MFKLEINDQIIPGMARIVKGLRDARDLTRAWAGTLESETEKNFAAQGRPAWLGLAPATLKRRGAGAKILQDSGQLAASVSTRYGRDYAQIGSNKVYALIQQLGGKIDRAAFSSWGALRTDRNGNLLRQGAEGRKKNLAVFAKGSHKRVKAIRYTVAAHQIIIPARPYLPFMPDGQIQPAARTALISDATAYLRSLVSP